MHHYFGPHFGGPHFWSGPGFLGLPGLFWLVLAGVLVWYFATRRKTVEQTSAQSAAQQSLASASKNDFSASEIGALRSEISELRRENEELRRTVKEALERLSKI